MCVEITRVMSKQMLGSAMSSHVFPGQTFPSSWVSGCLRGHGRGKGVCNLWESLSRHIMGSKAISSASYRSNEPVGKKLVKNNPLGMSFIRR